MSYLFVHFRDVHASFREHLHVYQTPEKNLQLWTFRPETVFDIFDDFLKRLKQMRDIFEIGNEFTKLDKVEIGGVNGRQINRAILSVTYDPYQYLV